MIREMNVDQRVYVNLDLKTLIDTSLSVPNFQHTFSTYKIEIDGQRIRIPYTADGAVNLMLKMINILRKNNPGVDLYINIPHVDMQLRPFVNQEFTLVLQTILEAAIQGIDRVALNPLYDIHNGYERWEQVIEKVGTIISDHKGKDYTSATFEASQLVKVAYAIIKQNLTNAVLCLMSNLDDHCRISYGCADGSIAETIVGVLSDEAKTYQANGHQYPFNQCIALPEALDSANSFNKYVQREFGEQITINMFRAKALRGESRLGNSVDDYRNYYCMTADGVVTPINVIVLRTGVIDIMDDSNMDIIMSGNIESLYYVEDGKLYLGDNMKARLRGVVGRFRDTLHLTVNRSNGINIPWVTKDVEYICPLSVTGLEDLASSIIAASRPERYGIINAKTRKAFVTAFTKRILLYLNEAVIRSHQQKDIFKIVLAHAIDTDPIEFDPEEIGDATMDIISQCRYTNFTPGGYMITVRICNADKLTDRVIDDIRRKVINTMISSGLRAASIQIVGRSCHQSEDEPDESTVTIPNWGVSDDVQNELASMLDKIERELKDTASDPNYEPTLYDQDDE